MLTPQETAEVREKILSGLSVTRIAREHRVHYSVVHRVSREMEEMEPADMIREDGSS